MIPEYNPLSYVDFIANSDEERLLHFITTYPDITQTVTTENSVEITEKFKKYNFNTATTPNLTTGFGILHFLCKYWNWHSLSENNEKIITEVIARNQDSIDLRTQDGDTALMLLFSDIYRDEVIVEVAKILIDNSADVNAMNYRTGETALMLAAKNAETEEVCGSVSILLDHGADVNAKSTKGRTPLMFAITACSELETLELLLDAGADVNARDYVDSSTPLLYATHSLRFDEYIPLLIKSGAKAHDTDNYGKNAVCVLAERFTSASQFAETAKLLVDAGADVTNKNTRRLLEDYVVYCDSAPKNSIQTIRDILVSTRTQDQK